MNTSMNSAFISASILSADFANLGADASAALSAGANGIHFDVMDHHFVPNLSFGSVICQALRQYSITAPIDVHLMVDNPADYIEPFAKAGASMLVFHPETVTDVTAVLETIHQHGMQAGLAFNPDKPVAIEKSWWPLLNMILIMSVFPGFAGQKFIPESLAKLADTRAQIDKNNTTVRLGIDGGINLQTIGQVTEAGADFFVVGSGLFSAEDYQARVTGLRTAIAVGLTQHG